MRAIVKSPRITDYPNPLKLNVGDIVTVMEFCSTLEWRNWVKCQHNDNIGWIPKDVLRLTDASTAQVTEPYDATELDVTRAETFIYSKTVSGWAWGNIEGTSKMGWVPLEILDEF